MPLGGGSAGVAPSGYGIQYNRFRGEQVPAGRSFFHTFLSTSVPSLTFLSTLPPSAFLHCGTAHCYLYSLIVGPGGQEFCSQIPLDTVFERQFRSFTQSSIKRSFHNNALTSPLKRLSTFSLFDRARWVTQIAQIVPREASPGCQKTTISRWPTPMMLPSTYP